MLDQIINYYNNMNNLKNQGVPLDWEKIAGAMFTTLQGMKQQELKAQIAAQEAPAPDA